MTNMIYSRLIILTRKSVAFSVIHTKQQIDKMAIPLIGRLRALEWPILAISLVLIALESIISFITRILPAPVIVAFRRMSSRLLSLLPSPEAEELSDSPPLKNFVKRLSESPGFVEMCQLFGYEAEEHIVRTTDGYLLGIHRIGGPRGTDWRRKSDMRNGTAGRSSSKKPVVYLHHGLLMNSEVWIANVDYHKCLPFVLADLGYDVWLGNNRGNKYSKKHITRVSSEKQFWNFSLDDFALYDIPDTIEYILQTTEQKDLVYIGFSQGSAQAFASLSIHPSLNCKVKLFIALAPAMAPPALKNRIVTSLVKASPSMLYLFFGKKALLKSTTFWQSIMLPALFVRTIDFSLDILFKWKCKNISYAQKLVGYSHLYSYTSVKSVVHWFQIIKSGSFHMYDDEVYNPLLGSQYYYKAAPFPTRNIMTPIVLIYGKADSLVDINVMLAELPQGTAHIGIPDYEHLDIIWGDRVDSLIFPYVLSALRRLESDNRPCTRKHSNLSTLLPDTIEKTFEVA